MKEWLYEDTYGNKFEYRVVQPLYPYGGPVWCSYLFASWKIFAEISADELRAKEAEIKSISADM